MEPGNLKTVLYASDRSEHTIEALNYAHALSRELQCHLYVFHVYSLPPVSRSTIRNQAQYKKRILEEQQKLLQTYCEKNLVGGLTEDDYTVVVEEAASVADATLEKSKALNADILVVGMKDSHSKRGLLAGNIAFSLLKKATCPVLLIPNDKPFRIPKKLVYATDFEQADFFAIREILPFAKAFGAGIEVVHIPVEGEYPGKDQMEWFQELLIAEINYDRLDFGIFQATSVTRGIVDFARERNADLVAMLERGQKGLLNTLFHKDRLKTVSQHLETPLLSVRQRL